MISYVVLPTLLLTEVNKLDKLSQVLNINGTGLYQKKIKVVSDILYDDFTIKIIIFCFTG